MLPELVRNVLPSLEMRNFRRERHRKSFILSDYELPEGLKVILTYLLKGYTILTQSVNKYIRKGLHIQAMSLYLQSYY